MDDKTSSYSVKEFNAAYVETIINEVCTSLTERGYNAINQLSGYLMSGDPGYISSYQDARKKITSIDRSIIIEYLLRKSFGENKWNI